MIISVELVGIDGVSRRCDIAKVDRSLDGARLNDFGLSLEEAKEIQRRLQQELTQFQADQAGQRDRKCQDCNRRRSVHGSRYRTIHSLFGSCQVRVPRWCRCAWEASRPCWMAGVPPSWSASNPNWAPGCHFEKQPVYLISFRRPRGLILIEREQPAG